MTQPANTHSLTAESKLNIHVLRAITRAGIRPMTGHLLEIRCERSRDECQAHGQRPSGGWVGDKEEAGTALGIQPKARWPTWHFLSLFPLSGGHTIDHEPLPGVPGPCVPLVLLLADPRLYLGVSEDPLSVGPQ